MLNSACNYTPTQICANCLCVTLTWREWFSRCGLGGRYSAGDVTGQAAVRAKWRRGVCCSRDVAGWCWGRKWLTGSCFCRSSCDRQTLALVSCQMLAKLWWKLCLMSLVEADSLTVWQKNPLWMDVFLCFDWLLGVCVCCWLKLQIANIQWQAVSANTFHFIVNSHVKENYMLT